MTVAPLPDVSIIVPCRREKQWIARCLDSVLDSDYPRERLEVLVVDGMSDDGTRETIYDYAERFSCVRLIDNPRLSAPAALNIGIALAKGEIIVRMDAHCFYPPDYVSSLVDSLQRSGADNVGGALLTTPADGSSRARGIAAALAHPFGVGNSYFRIGSRVPRYVDTVPFGCYRRSVFDRLGGFDEELVRNQDDEFNARLRRAGGRILLVPSIVSRYVARESLRKLFHMQFEYGLYKPLAAMRLGGLYTARQLVPPAFVAGAAVLALLSIVEPVARLAFLALGAAYLVGVVASASAARGSLGLWPRVWMCLAFPVLHFAYGTGYLAGLAGLLWSRKSDYANSRNDTVRLTR